VGWDAPGGAHGFVPVLTSFIGRRDEVDEVAGLLVSSGLLR
jgi:hypothetical protein